MNEALPYVEAVHEIYEGEATGVGHVPSWMVIDQRYRNRYLFAGLDAAPAVPRPLVQGRASSRRPRRSRSSPPRSSVPADALEATVERFNGFAATGVDEDFHRGESAYDKYYSDPTVKPNPSLHVIDQAPFYAVKIVPGDLGTKGGLVTDERARVLRAGRLGDPGPLRRRQRVVGGDGPHLRRPRRHHRPGAGVRLPGRRGHRRRLSTATRSSQRDRLMPIDPDRRDRRRTSAPARSPGPRATCCSTTSASAPAPARATTSTRTCCATPPSTGDLQVLPSFGVVAPTFHETDPPPLDLPGCDINLAQVVHGSQSITVHAPLPTSGTATLTTTLTDVWDKGKAAVIWQEGVRRRPRRASRCGRSGRRSSSGARAAGAATAARRSRSCCPTASPTPTTTYAITPQQALLYRLCGDRNPLHSDPDFAKAAGFPAPILHGLCSYGIVLRELTDALLGGDATLVGGFAAKFAGVVFPGETIRVRGWHEDGRIVGAATVADGERDDAPVLGDVVVTLA